jgi:hypothetical protein
MPAAVADPVVIVPVVDLEGFLAIRHSVVLKSVVGSRTLSVGVFEGKNERGQLVGRPRSFFSFDWTNSSCLIFL